MRVLLTFLTLLLIFVHTRAPYKWLGHPRRAHTTGKGESIYKSLFG